MKKYAVIVAAGSGTRMGKEIPKQFLTLGARPILYYTLDAFFTAYPDINVILVISPRYMKWGEDIAKAFHDFSITLAEGGKTRFQSVKNGLSLIHDHSVIFVHDGVRCLVTGQLIRHCYEQAIVKGSSIPTVAVTETVRILEGDNHHMLDRNLVRMVQTPQTFLSTILLRAYETEEKGHFTDEASVVEHSGEKVYLIEGEYTNVKITRPQDMAIAEEILRLRGLATE
ncbi:MAG TPA: 2-C-methyl-D-erythritol 4-phosphate cytidylyltransferase [Flavitalea sp.]|nr:2-C-methyl-D-erythritol 4-phosphate cytidylyltransferase [Flavitalea sp.]